MRDRRASPSDRRAAHMWHFTRTLAQTGNVPFFHHLDGELALGERSCSLQLSKIARLSRLIRPLCVRATVHHSLDSCSKVKVTASELLGGRGHVLLPPVLESLSIMKLCDAAKSIYLNHISCLFARLSSSSPSYLVIDPGCTVAQRVQEKPKRAQSVTCQRGCIRCACAMHLEQAANPCQTMINLALHLR